jgi:hypothetical protein
VAAVEQCHRVRAGGGEVVGDRDALAGGEAVVLHDPGLAEVAQCGVETGGVVDDLAVGGRHAGRGHDLLGERLRALDARGRGGRAEAGDPLGPDGVRGTGDEWDLGTDDDEAGLPFDGEVGDRRRVGDVHAVGLGDRGGAGVAGRARERNDRRVEGQREQQRMLAGAGADNQDTHEQRE